MNNHGPRMTTTIDMVVMKDFTRSVFTDAELALVYNSSLQCVGKIGNTCNDVRVMLSLHKKPNGDICLCNNATLRNSDKLYQFELDDSCNVCGSKISLDIARGRRIQERLITILEAKTRQANIIPRQPQLPCAFCGVYFSNTIAALGVVNDVINEVTTDMDVDTSIALAVDLAVASVTSNSVAAPAVTSTNKRHDVWISLTCNHDFHFECWKAWRLNRSCMCPLCNIPFDFQFPTQ